MRLSFWLYCLWWKTDEDINLNWGGRDILLREAHCCHHSSRGFLFVRQVWAGLGGPSLQFYHSENWGKRIMKSLSPSWNISSRSARVRLFRKFSGPSSIHRSTNFSTVGDQGEWKAGSQLISSFFSDWAPSTLGGNTQIRVIFPLKVKPLCQHPQRHPQKCTSSEFQTLSQWQWRTVLGDLIIILVLFLWSSLSPQPAMVNLDCPLDWIYEVRRATPLDGSVKGFPESTISGGEGWFPEWVMFLRSSRDVKTLFDMSLQQRGTGKSPSPLRSAMLLQQQQCSSVDLLQNLARIVQGTCKTPMGL